MHHHVPTTPRTDRVAVVVNTASRSGARALPLVTSELRRASDEVVVHPAHGGLELLDALGAAMDDEPDLLVVGGGDGTIGCAAGLVRTRAPRWACSRSAPPTTSPGRSRSRSH